MQFPGFAKARQKRNRALHSIPIRELLPHSASCHKTNRLNSNARASHRDWPLTQFEGQSSLQFVQGSNNLERPWRHWPNIRQLRHDLLAYPRNNPASRAPWDKRAARIWPHRSKVHPRHQPRTLLLRSRARDPAEAAFQLESRCPFLAVRSDPNFAQRVSPVRAQTRHQLDRVYGSLAHAWWLPHVRRSCAILLCGDHELSNGQRWSSVIDLDAPWLDRNRGGGSQFQPNGSTPPTATHSSRLPCSTTRMLLRGVPNTAT